MSNIVEDLRRAVVGRYPLVYLCTWEEDRALRLLESFSAKVFPDRQLPVMSWSCVRGFDAALGDGPAIDPVAAVEAVRRAQTGGFFVLRDLAPFMERPEVVRVLREAYYELRNGDKTIFITAPEITVPEDLKKEILVVEMSLPDENEQLRLVQGYCQSYSVQLDEQLLSDMAFGLKGLSVNEATHTLNRIFRSKAFGREQILEEIFKDKETVVKKAGYLEYVRAQQGIEDIGGLENLKDWLMRRRTLFGRQALADGLPIPKGMLVMGMSGCGKSLAAKVVANLWRLPLFRLDMNLVNSGIFGKPEAAFHRALRTVEALAPAVLWIDEIENALGMDSETGASNAGIFSSFLTWMQEKPPLIFVAATANRIQALPAEVIRKGRFDQVFFVDLPSPEERKQIFGIHLSRNDADIAQFDLEILAMATKAWNGAEIEQAVNSARVDAYAEGSPLNMAHLTRSTSQTVPLSKTMHEQMKAIRSWAFGRATLASKEKYAEV